MFCSHCSSFIDILHVNLTTGISRSLFDYFLLPALHRSYLDLRYLDIRGNIAVVLLKTQLYLINWKTQTCIIFDILKVSLTLPVRGCLLENDLSHRFYRRMPVPMTYFTRRSASLLIRLSCSLRVVLLMFPNFLFGISAYSLTCGRQRMPEMIGTQVTSEMLPRRYQRSSTTPLYSKIPTKCWQSTSQC